MDLAFVFQPVLCVKLEQFWVQDSLSFKRFFTSCFGKLPTHIGEKGGIKGGDFPRSSSLTKRWVKGKLSTELRKWRLEKTGWARELVGNAWGNRWGNRSWESGTQATRNTRPAQGTGCLTRHGNKQLYRFPQENIESKKWWSHPTFSSRPCPVSPTSPKGREQEVKLVCLFIHSTNICLCSGAFVSSKGRTPVALSQGEGAP